MIRLVREYLKLEISDVEKDLNICNLIELEIKDITTNKLTKYYASKMNVPTNKLHNILVMKNSKVGNFAKKAMQRVVETYK